MSVDLALDVGARYVRLLSRVQKLARNTTLTSFQSIITLVFFITYVLFQPPATVLTRKIGPRNFLPIIALLWGATMIGFGFARDWNALIGLRMLLGVLEVCLHRAVASMY